jgi:hypothetical protein
MIFISSFAFLMQGPVMHVPPSAIIAVNSLASCLIYEAIQEASHEVCFRLPATCPGPHEPQAMLLSLARLAPCCNPQLHTIASAFFLRITFHRLLYFLYDQVHSARVHSGLLPRMSQLSQSQTFLSPRLHHKRCSYITRSC